jgi:hypothetical protein
MAGNSASGCVGSLAGIPILILFYFAFPWLFWISIVIIIVIVVTLALRKPGAGTATGEDDDDESDDSDDDEDGDPYAAPGCRQLHTIVVGTKYNNDDGSNRSQIISWMAVGERLLLEPYLYNEEPAVGVYNSKGYMMGNLPKELAEEFTEKLKSQLIGPVYLSRKRKVDGYYRANMTINIKNRAPR